MLRRVGTTVFIVLVGRVGLEWRRERGADGCCRGGGGLGALCAVRGDDATIECWGDDVGRRSRGPVHRRRGGRPADLRGPRGGRRGRLLGPELLGADSAVGRVQVDHRRRRAVLRRPRRRHARLLGRRPVVRHRRGARGHVRLGLGRREPRLRRAHGSHARLLGLRRLRHGTPPAGEFCAVAAGTSHSCGVRTDGALACWGAEWMLDPPAGEFSARSRRARSSPAPWRSDDGTPACWGAESARRSRRRRSRCARSSPACGTAAASAAAARG